MAGRSRVRRRRVPFKPAYPGEYPTLGWGMLDWYSSMLASPDRVEYTPLRLTTEQANFVLQFYRLDPKTGKRVYSRGVYSRPKGSGKSPMVAALGLGEALGPVLFDGWDANGRPVGKPWSEVRKPLVQFAAVSEEQTRNAYGPLLDMLTLGPAVNYYGVTPMKTFVDLGGFGEIRYVTSSGLSREGDRAVFAAMDQTESWIPSNGGVNFANVLRRNAAKVGGSTVETPNAYTPGLGSVSELTAKDYELQSLGRTRSKDTILFDHREAPADTDMSDPKSLRAGLLYAYGDSAVDNGGWVDIDRLMEEIYTPSTDPQMARQYYLNQVTHASDSWLSRPEVMACVDRSKQVAPGAQIVLGFDGSRGRVKGKADATALIGMDVEQRHVFQIAVWERREMDPQDWAPNAAEVDAVVRETFQKYDVLGFYADPSGWDSQVAGWEAAFGRQLRVRASQNQPIAAWPRGKDTRVAEYVEKFRQAIVNRELTWDGSPTLLTHMLNARRRALRRGGYLLYKAYPMSPDKIDAAYAAVMAYKACLDVVGRGVVRAPRRPRGKVFMG